MSFWGFWCGFRWIETVFGSTPWISAKKSHGFSWFSEKSPTLRGCNFIANGPFGMSRHCTIISWLTFIYFYRFWTSQTRANHLNPQPENMFFKICMHHPTTSSLWSVDKVQFDNFDYFLHFGEIMSIEAVFPKVLLRFCLVARFVFKIKKKLLVRRNLKDPFKDFSLGSGEHFKDLLKSFEHFKNQDFLVRFYHFSTLKSFLKVFLALF